MSRLLVVAVSLLAVAGAQEPADPVPALIAQLAAGKPKERAHAARSLGKKGGERVIRALGAALDDGAACVRHEAAIALARLAPEDPRPVGVLIESLRGEDWYARWQTCLALRSLGPRAKEAVPDLIRVLGDPKLDNGREATLALAAIAPQSPAVVEALLKALDAPYAVDRRAVIFALGRAGTAVGRAVPWLAREVHDDKHGCRDAAHRLLERAMGDDAEYSLMLFDPEEERRVRAAAWFSGAAKHIECKEAAILVFAAALKDESREVRWHLLQVLGKIGDFATAKTALPDIVRRLVSIHPEEQEKALEALKAVAPSLARVIEIHEDEKKDGTFTATLSFRVDPPDREGSQALLKVLTDPAVGDATLAALAEISGRTKEDLLAAVRAELAKERKVEPGRGK